MATTDIGSTIDSTANTLEISNTELGFVTAPMISFGNAGAGAITVSADINRAVSTAMQLVSNSDITISGGSINTGGGTLLLDSGVSPAAIKATKSGTDVTASMLSFGSDLAIVINGTTVDTQYTQLNVVGGVNLTGVDLVIGGGYQPTLTDSFTLVSNDGNEAVVGTFNGLPEGSLVTINGGAIQKRITYVGGSGSNDVVLAPVDYIVTVTATTITVTDQLGNGDTLQITQPSAGNIQFGASGRTFSINGGPATNAGSGPISRTGITNITVNAQGGNDTITLSEVNGALQAIRGAGEISLPLQHSAELQVPFRQPRIDLERAHHVPLRF